MWLEGKHFKNFRLRKCLPSPWCGCDECNHSCWDHQSILSMVHRESLQFQTCDLSMKQSWWLRATWTIEVADKRYRINSKSVSAPVHPVDKNIPHCGDNSWITVVKIGLTRSKLMKVILLTFLIPSPSSGGKNCLLVDWVDDKKRFRNKKKKFFLTQLLGGSGRPPSGFSFPSCQT